MSSKIHYTYQSINKSRTQIPQVTWWPGPCKQIQALIGVWNCINCKNNGIIIMFINHPDSGMLQHRVFYFHQKRLVLIIEVSDVSRYIHLASFPYTLSTCQNKCLLKINSQIWQARRSLRRSPHPAFYTGAG